MEKLDVKKKFIESVNYSSSLNYYKSKKIIENLGGFSEHISKYLSRFENVIVINSLKEYVHFINSLLLNKYKKKSSNDLIREKYIFRGISKISQLKSTINRYYDEFGYLNNEFEFVRKFEENGSLKIGQFNNPIDLAAAAQHYGVYTRLIDWTYSPLIATLFSLFEKNENFNHDYYGVLFRNYRESLVLSSLNEEEVVSNCSMNKRYASMMKKLDEVIETRNQIFAKTRNKLSTLKNEEYEFIEEYYPDFKEDLPKIKKILFYFDRLVRKMKYDKSEDEIKIITYQLFRKFMKSDMKIFIETNFSNERLRAQRGLFEIDCMNNEIDKFKGTSIILIASSARLEIIKYIDKLGFGYYQLMDDPSNAAITINKTIKGEYSYDRKIYYDYD